LTIPEERSAQNEGFKKSKPKTAPQYGHNIFYEEVKNNEKHIA
jgi:hypothetical protein